MILNREIHRPYIHENKESKTMVIFVHGILEGPNQFEQFADVVSELGLSYSAILLDGHGKSGKDFAKSSKNKWLNTIETEILRHKDNYQNIILVGHSMGALLSILMTSKYKNIIQGIVLIAAPLKVFVRINIMVSSIKIALGYIKAEDTLTCHAQRAFSVERCSLLTYISWIPRYKDLFRLIIETKKEIKNITIPTMIIQSKIDELVSYRSVGVFNKKLKNDYQILRLEKSGHFYYDEDELIDILKEFKRFIVGFKDFK